MADASDKSPGQLAIAVGEAEQRLNEAIIAAAKAGLRVEVYTFEIGEIFGPRTKVRAEVLLPLDTRRPR